MRRFGVGWLAALLVGAGLLASETASAQSGLSNVVSQDREVLVDIEVVEESFSSCVPLIDPDCLPDSTTNTYFADSASAEGAGPFVATASRPEFPSTFASQDSEITSDTIRASGSHAATASFSNTGGFPITFHSEFHDVESRAIVTIQIDAVVTYSLAGSVTTGGSVFSTSSSHVRLSGPGGVIAEVQVDSDPNCLDPGCFTIGPEPVSASGSLDPGVYLLEARASGSAGGIHSTSGSFGTGVDGAFEVELTLAPPPLPSLTPGAVALLALALGASGAARLSRRDESATDRFPM